MTAKQPDLFANIEEPEEWSVPAWLRRAPMPVPTRAPLRLKANGYDVTDRMPLTVAELERQRPE